ncbi:MAG: hypothetical protein K0R63_25 [Rickettsiales bacterium]|jgi:hypothetical protein|nr:hypothetical protein [Rickettsiales bacterium]
MATNTINKKALLTHIIALLTREAESLAHGAKVAHEGATNAESKPENKYDTRGLEASYLAGAQAKMAASAVQNLAVYEKLELKDFTDGKSIALSAFIELESGEAVRSFYFLGPNGGGVEVIYEGIKILLITPSSPIGGRLLGCEVGDMITMRTGSVTKEYEIVSVL